MHSQDFDFSFIRILNFSDFQHAQLYVKKKANKFKPCFSNISQCNERDEEREREERKITSIWGELRAKSLHTYIY